MSIKKTDPGAVCTCLSVALQPTAAPVVGGVLSHLGGSILSIMLMRHLPSVLLLLAALSVSHIAHAVNVSETSGVGLDSSGHATRAGHAAAFWSGPAALEDTSTLNPDALARFPVRQLQLGSVSLTPSTTFGIRLQEEPSIPDLGSQARDYNPLDTSAIAQDIQASSNRLLTQHPRRNALRMNWLKVDTPEYRLDLTQHPSRTGLRFHHIASGLRIEAERRLINSGMTLFVGVRLLEDRRFDPTVGCSYNSNAQVESRVFCGFRLRIGI